MTGDGSKVQCCKEKYCIGTWNVRSMNQGKLEVVKQEMARIDISGLSELQWMGMGDSNSDGQESLRRNSHHSQQESKMQYLDAISKMRE